MSEETKFTPSEWKASGNGVHKGSRCVAIAFDPDARESEMTEVTKANARLIAAAPELLAACQKAKRYMDKLNARRITEADEGTTVLLTDCYGLTAAINKALGKE